MDLLGALSLFDLGSAAVANVAGLFADVLGLILLFAP